MESLENYSNSEIIKIISNLGINHEKVKKEIIILHEILLNIEKDYVELMKELEKRK